MQGEVPFQEGIQGRPVVRRYLSSRGHERATGLLSVGGMVQAEDTAPLSVSIPAEDRETA